MSVARNKVPEFRKFFTDDAILETTAGSMAASGRKPVVTALKEVALLRSIFRNGIKFDIQSIVAEDETVHVEVRGTSKTPQGVDYNNRYVFILEFIDGKIKELREYQDSALLERVLMPFWTV
jgi:ketosteroid isomerase-like protein